MLISRENRGTKRSNDSISSVINLSSRFTSCVIHQRLYYVSVLLLCLCTCRKCRHRAVFLINALNDEFYTIAVFSAWRASVVCNRSNLVFIIVVCLVGSAFVAYWVSTYIYPPICVYTLTIGMWQVFFITSERTHVHVIETRQIWCQDIPHLSLSSQRASVTLSCLLRLLY